MDSQPGVSRLSPKAVTIGLTAAVVILAVTWRHRPSHSIDSLAVLPFVNMSGSEDTDYRSRIDPRRARRRQRCQFRFLRGDFLFDTSISLKRPIQEKVDTVVPKSATAKCLEAIRFGAGLCRRLRFGNGERADHFVSFDLFDHDLVRLTADGDVYLHGFVDGLVFLLHDLVVREDFERETVVLRVGLFQRDPNVTKHLACFVLDQI